MPLHGSLLPARLPHAQQNGCTAKRLIISKSTRRTSSNSNLFSWGPQVADLQMNRLKEVPQELGALSRLAVLNLASNELTTLPSGGLGGLQQSPKQSTIAACYAICVQTPAAEHQAQHTSIAPSSQHSPAPCPALPLALLQAYACPTWRCST